MKKTKLKKPYWDNLEKCAKIAKERGTQYGDVKDNLTTTATLLYVMGIKLTPADIAMVMVMNKLAREAHLHKEDNIDDAINYLAIYNSLVDQPTS